MLNPFKPELSPQERLELARQVLLCDTYIVSVNAVVEDGRLMSIDSLGNGVAAMLFGPRRVIVVVGRNKIVKDLDEAIHRIKT